MIYQTYPPHPELAPVVQCYWTLEIPADPTAEKQRIVPDGTIEMAFILGDDIKRFTTESDYILQPRAMILGQITQPFYIQPIGCVHTFAIRFYPYGFANFITTPLSELSNKETALDLLFDKSETTDLVKEIMIAKSTDQRIGIIEKFLINKLNSTPTINNIVKNTVEILTSTTGKSSINSILKNEPSKRRQLERNFAKQIGMSPKQLGKVIRLQAALKMMLNEKADSLTQIAYESEYYDQAHFIRDFKEFTGTTPTEFIDAKNMVLSSLIYKND